MMAYRTLPVEIWRDISQHLTLSSFRSLLLTNRYFKSILDDPVCKRKMLIRYFDDSIDEVFLFSFRYKLNSIIYSLISADSLQNINDISSIFSRVACTESICAEEEETKLNIIRAILSSPIIKKPKVSKLQLSASDMALMAFKWSVYYAEKDIIKYILEDYGLNLNCIKCHSKWLIRMLHERKFELLEYLLQKGALIYGSNTIDSRFEENLTISRRNSNLNEVSTRTASAPLQDFTHPLTITVFDGDIDGMKFLLRKTWYRDNIVAYQQALQTSLLASAYADTKDALSVLVNEYGVNLIEEDDGSEVLLLAISSGSSKFVKEYLEIFPIEFLDDGIVTLGLNTAVKSGDICMLETLLTKLRIDINAHGNLLDLAVNHGHQGMVNFLVNRGADVSMNRYEVIKSAILRGNLKFFTRLFQRKHRNLTLQKV